MFSFMLPQEFVFCDPDVITSWLQKVASGTLVTPLEHNSAMMHLAAACDAIAQPTRAPMVGTSLYSAAYEVTTYRGPIAGYDGKVVPVVGIYPAPADADRLLWWGATVALGRRLHDNLEVSTGTPVAPTNAGKLYALSGSWAGLAEPPRWVAENSTIKEDPNTAPAVSQVLVAVDVFARRVQLQAAGSAAVPVEGAETSARPLITQLSREFDGEAMRAFYVTAGAGVIAIGGGYVAGRMASKAQVAAAKRAAAMGSER